jgi:DNA invertase Pin-like site-specific DNA recombinase
VHRQVERPRVYAARKGWTIAENHVYADDGVAGGAFGEHRPGLARLLLALKPRPAFQTLIMLEESRLGRLLDGVICVQSVVPPG